MCIIYESCGYKMSKCEILGYATAEMFKILKNRLQRGMDDNFAIGFANDEKIACPICKKYAAWISNTNKPNPLVKEKKAPQSEGGL